MTDITQKGKVSGDSDLKGQMRLAFTSLEYLLLLRRACAYGSGVHHHSCGFVLAQQSIQFQCKLFRVKVGVAHFDSQMYISRPRIEKCFKLRQVSNPKGWWKLQKNWPQARP